MSKSKNKLFEYAKELYKLELEKKEILNSNISTPLAIITIQIGAYSTLFTDIPTFTLKFPNIVLFIVSFISLIMLGFSIWFFYKHQKGFTYGYISSPKELKVDNRRS